MQCFCRLVTAEQTALSHVTRMNLKSKKDCNRCRRGTASKAGVTGDLAIISPQKALEGYRLKYVKPKIL